MPKRVKFNIDEEEDEDKCETKIPFGKKFKHTLDSDEEDDEVESKKYELNFSDNIFEGEEEGNLRKDEGVMITPFNIQEELKEGHFDKQGMYIYRKKGKEIRDNWLDNIDWINVKENDVESTSKLETTSTKQDESSIAEFYKKLFELMEPSETVKKAMQRLGKKNLQNKLNKNKNRQKIKKQETCISSLNENDEIERKSKLNLLIELSDKILSTGDTDIYEKKYETIKYHIEQHEKQKTLKTDIFADD